MDLLNLLDELQLDHLDEEWVESVWNEDFLHTQELPVDYQFLFNEIDFERIISQSVLLIKSNVNYDNSKTLSNVIKLDWKFFFDQNFKHKALLALLFYILRDEITTITDYQRLTLALKAANLYFQLLKIPGSSVFMIYNHNIFCKALETLSLGHSLIDFQKLNSYPSKHHADQEIDSNNYLSPREKSHVLYELNMIVLELNQLLKIFHLNDECLLEKIICQLVFLTRLEITRPKFNPDFVMSRDTISSLSYNAYIALKDICSPLQGKVEYICSTILKHLLPSVLMVGDFACKLSFHNLSVINCHTVNFVQFLLHTIKEQSYHSVQILLQHLCMKVKDKADYKQKISQCIIEIINVLPQKQYEEFVNWLFQFAHFKKTVHRQFALEVIGRLLHEDDRVPEGNALCGKSDSSNSGSDSADDRNSYEIGNNELNSVPYLVALVFGRCRDVAICVRTKALQILADCLRTDVKYIRNIMEGIFVTPYKSLSCIFLSKVEKKAVSYQELLMKMGDLNCTDIFPDGIAFVIDVTDLLDDESVFVRKAALQVLFRIMKMTGKWMSDDLLGKICKHCRDPAVLIRKECVQFLTELLLSHYNNPSICKIYLKSVLPLIEDNELSVQERVRDALSEVILSNVKEYSKGKDDFENIPWVILQLICELKLKKLFVKVCLQWSQRNLLMPRIVDIIKTHISTENNVGAWLILSCIACKVRYKNSEFVWDYILRLQGKDSHDAKYTVQLALDILKWWSCEFTVDLQQQICNSLLSSCTKLSLDITHIGPAVDLVSLICKANGEKNQFTLENFYEILAFCECFIKNNFPPSVPKCTEEEFLRCVITVGEISLLIPNKSCRPTEEILLKILSDPRILNVVVWDSERIIAATVITIGKLCLHNEQLSLKVTPLMGKILRSTEASVVKVNIMAALHDICVRFTSMVEPLIPDMCISMKDYSNLVRENSIVTLIQLLQQDYLKLKGHLFFDLLSMINDPDVVITELVRYYFVESFIPKHKNTICQYIIEGVFYYNNYKGHDKYEISIPQTEGRIHFDLTGKQNERKRLSLYQFILEYIDDDHRLHTMNRLCNDVLGSIVEDKLILSEPGIGVFSDTISILMSNEIRLKSLQDQAEYGTNETDMVQNIVNSVTIKKTLISELFKKNLIENIIPVLLNLKNKFESLLSPYKSVIVKYILYLMKDYKDEVQEILRRDKRTAVEVLYDLDKSERSIQDLDLEQSQDGLTEKEINKHNLPAIEENKTSNKTLNLEHNAKSKSSKRSRLSSSDGSGPSKCLRI